MWRATVARSFERSQRKLTRILGRFCRKKRWNVGVSLIISAVAATFAFVQTLRLDPSRRTASTERVDAERRCSLETLSRSEREYRRQGSTSARGARKSRWEIAVPKSGPTQPQT